MPHIRVSARAIIFDNNNILLIKRVGSKFVDNGEYYVLPGGGIEPGETAHQAIVREIREESGLTVSAGELLFVQDIQPDGTIHNPIAHMSMVFRCELTNSNKLTEPEIPDNDPEGLYSQPVWFPIQQLHTVNFLPRIAENIQNYYKNGSLEPRYFAST